jgi:hypothetical protein
MRRLLSGLIACGLLSGCAGNAADYWVPKPRLIDPVLIRYGLDAGQTQCVGQQLTERLSVLQLRQLIRTAEAAAERGNYPTPLRAQHLLFLSSHVEDPAVAAALAAAADACGVVSVAAEPVAAAAPEPAPDGPAAARPAVWLNLGSAPTGQSIAVDASSIRDEPGFREAWIRLTSPGQAEPDNRAFLLRVDCAMKTLNAMATRRYGPAGAIAEEENYGPTGQGVTQIEGGTVMEIAYLALCT